MAISMGLVAMLAAPAGALAADCQLKTDWVCTDTADRVISGLTVSRSCWDYQRVYSCLVPQAINYCEALESTQGCGQINSVCASTAFDGSCSKYTYTYSCSNALSPLPENIIKLSETYTITNEEDASACEQYKTDDCSLASHTCIEPGGTRVIEGQSVYSDCWKWEDHYTCAAKTMTTDCQPLIDKGCSEQGAASCFKYLADGTTCGAATRSFLCPKEETKTENKVCSESTGKVDYSCQREAVPTVVQGSIPGCAVPGTVLATFQANTLNALRIVEVICDVGDTIRLQSSGFGGAAVVGAVGQNWETNIGRFSASCGGASGAEYIGWRASDGGWFRVAQTCANGTCTINTDYAAGCTAACCGQDKYHIQTDSVTFEMPTKSGVTKGYTLNNQCADYEARVAP